jgi:hypothetical protein
VPTLVQFKTTFVVTLQLPTTTTSTHHCNNNVRRNDTPFALVATNMFPTGRMPNLMKARRAGATVTAWSLVVDFRKPLAPVTLMGVSGPGKSQGTRPKCSGVQDCMDARARQRNNNHDWRPHGWANFAQANQERHVWLPWVVDTYAIVQETQRIPRRRMSRGHYRSSLINMEQSGYFTYGYNLGDVEDCHASTYWHLTGGACHIVRSGWRVRFPVELYAPVQWDGFMLRL